MSIDATTRRGLILLVLAGILPIAQAEATWWPLITALICAVLAEGIFFSRSSRIQERERSASPRGNNVDGTALHWLVLIGAMASILVVVVEVFAISEPTPTILALSHFLVLLACCKFFELHTDRDVSIVLVMTLLLMVVGALVSGSVLFAAVLAFQLTYGLCWLVRFLQGRDMRAIADRIKSWQGDRHNGSASCGEGQAAPVVCSSTPTVVSVRVLAGVSPVLLMIAAATFVIVPRDTGQDWLGRLRGPVTAAVTGYSETVQLVSTGVLESDQPVMRVQLERAGQVLAGEDNLLYLRGATFEVYDGRRWHPHSGGWVRYLDWPSPDGMQTLSSAANRLPEEDLVIQRIWLERDNSSTLFSIYAPVAVATSADSGRIGQDTDDMTLRIRRRTRGPIQYTVVSAVRASGKLLNILEQERRDRQSQPIATFRARDRSGERYYERRPGRPRGTSQIAPPIGELARRLASEVGSLHDPSQYGRIVTRLRNFLQGPDFEYTLDPVPRAHGMDPIENFLFRARQGHCEFFASAMVLMCQSLGIDARLVIGYAGGEYNPVGGFYLIRKKDAHAWVEADLPDRGWTVFDPSPIAVDDAEKETRGVFALASDLFQYLQFEWVAFVVSYDASHRQHLLGKFEGWFLKVDPAEGWWSSAMSVVLALMKGPPELSGFQRALYWMLLALAVLLLVLTSRALWIIWLMLREYLSRPGGGDRVMKRRPEARFYDRLLVALERRGLSRPADMTPREFAVSVAMEDATLSPVRRLTDWYYEVQYGQTELASEQKAFIRAFLQFLREGAPLGQRPPTIDDGGAISG